MLADQVAQRRRGDHHLVRGDAPAADPLHQGLRDHRLQRFREHRADDFLLAGWKDIDDAVDGLRRRGGVQRGEHQMPGFRRGQRQANGLQVAQFADEDHVRVFAQRRSQRRGEALGVAPHLSLSHQALAARMQELDGLFDGENVLPAAAVDVVHHRRQRGALAAAGGAGDQHQALAGVGDALEHLPHAQFFKARHPLRHDAKRRAGATVGAKRVGAKAGEARHLEGEVQLGARQRLPRQRGNGFFDLPRLHRRQFQPLDVAVDAKQRRQPAGKVQVRRAPLDADRKQFFDTHEGNHSALGSAATNDIAPLARARFLSVRVRLRPRSVSPAGFAKMRP